jgi:hypothetical protein
VSETGLDSRVTLVTIGSVLLATVLPGAAADGRAGYLALYQRAAVTCPGLS